MARWGRGKSDWGRNGFDPKGPDAPDYFEHKVGWLIRRVRQDSESALLNRDGMREDKSKADLAAIFYTQVGILLNEYLEHDGNLDDGYEILFSHISERAFKRLAKEKYGLIGDPLD